MSAKTGKKKKGRVRTYFRGVKAETKKVSWPSRNDLMNYTGVVLFISVTVGVVIWLLDMGIHRILSLIIK